MSTRATARRQGGRSGLELLEEAFHLLRSSPPGVLASYAVGSLPFVLGLLWFWADMSRSPFAERHVDTAALGLAALFLWMKSWQAVFTRQLRAALLGQAPRPLGVRGWWRLLVSQVILQPTGLFLLPLSAVPLLTFPWVFACYQNITALADAESQSPLALLKAAVRQTSLWPRRNYSLTGLLLAFGLLVFVNWATFCFLLPDLLKMLFGLESVFTRSHLSMLNTTFFAAVLGLTYLCVDPLAKAAYTLRCFYGESLKSGADLKAELAQCSSAAPLAAACLLLLAVVPAAPAQSPPAPDHPAQLRQNAAASPPAVSAPELDHAIREVVRQDKYTWRMPRERIETPEVETPGVIGRFLERVRELLGRAWDGVWDVLQKLLRKLFQPARQSRTSGSGYGWIMLLQIMLYALIVAAAAGLALLLYRLWRNRHRATQSIASEPVQPTPDLADENVGPEQLPQDGWTRLGKELLAKGELRLALRAFYLASLAHLAERNLLSLARFKSNRDYERELRRRGHAFPELLDAFDHNVSIFERIWYGMHEVTAELVGDFAATVERMKGGLMPSGAPQSAPPRNL